MTVIHSAMALDHGGGGQRTHLVLNADFDEAASDGEDVADDEEDIPAVDELHAVGPAHFTAQGLPEEVHILLTNTQWQ